MFERFLMSFVLLWGISACTPVSTPVNSPSLSPSPRVRVSPEWTNSPLELRFVENLAGRLRADIPERYSRSLLIAEQAPGRVLSETLTTEECEELFRLPKELAPHFVTLLSKGEAGHWSAGLVSNLNTGIEGGLPLHLAISSPVEHEGRWYSLVTLFRPDFRKDDLTLVDSLAVFSCRWEGEKMVETRLESLAISARSETKLSSEALPEEEFLPQALRELKTSETQSFASSKLLEEKSLGRFAEAPLDGESFYPEQSIPDEVLPHLQELSWIEKPSKWEPTLVERLNEGLETLDFHVTISDPVKSGEWWYSLVVKFSPEHRKVDFVAPKSAGILRFKWEKGRIVEPVLWNFLSASSAKLKDV